MEISGINPSAPFSFLLPDKEDSGSTPAAVQDTVNISAPPLLQDEDVEGVLDDTLNMIAGGHCGRSFRTWGIEPEPGLRPARLVTKPGGFLP